MTTTIATTLPELHSLDQFRTFLQARGYFAENSRVDGLFNLPLDQRGLLEGARIVAVAGEAVDDNTLVVIHVPRADLNKDVRKRLRRQLKDSQKDALLVCAPNAANWQTITLYLLLQTDDAEELPQWTLNVHAPRPQDRRALEGLDLRDEDVFELDLPLRRAFRRAHRAALYTNQGLFSSYYLDERLPDDHAEWRAMAAAMPALSDQIRAILGAANEATDQIATEKQIVQPLLKALGWTIERAAAGKRYDLLLKANNAPVAICNVVAWHLSLETQAGDGAQGAPDLRMIAALDEQKNGGVQFGLLTNGQTWRLFGTFASSTSGVYYEVDLRDLRTIGSDDDLRLWAAFFGPRGLAQPAGSKDTALVLRVYQDGQRHAQKVGEDLKEAIFDQVFRDLATGLAEAMRRRGDDVESEESLRLIYRATLILLYRLLFLLYAEARHLLPLLRLPYYPHSLTFLLQRIALQKHGLVPTGEARPLAPDAPWIWQHLRELFRAIDAGNAAWGVPRYNGGLFSANASDAHRLLDGLDVVGADRLALGLDGLARDAHARGANEGDPTARSNRALKLIDFMALDVRRLGSIYEGLLEFRLRWAESDLMVVDGRYVPAAEVSGKKKQPATKIRQGELYLENSRHERKASGSYYTPDYIVRYIVEHAVGPVLQERARRFADQMTRLRKARTDRSRAQATATIREADLRVRELEQAASEALLDLKVLDPAMGSGHFLVAAVDFLSDRMIRILDDYPDNPIYAQLDQIGQSIRQSVIDQGVDQTFLDERHLSPTNLLRRMVMKRCVYGVDLNDLAVELARLSLWLHSFTVGAPLSFLDHHLKHGNSLIGVWDIESYIAPGSERWNKFMLALTNMVRIGRLTDSTASELQESYDLYREAQDWIRPTKEQLNVDLATKFAALGDVGQARRVAYMDEAQRAASDPTTIGKFDQAQAVARNKRFFHWKLEFAEAFVDLDRQDWKGEDAGFDAVVGNPPYIRSVTLREADVSAWSYYPKMYKVAAKREYDIYLCFIEHGFDLIKKQGYFGMIVPNKWFTTQVGQSLRELLTKHQAIQEIVDYGSFQLFEGITVYPSLLFLNKKAAGDFSVFVLSQAQAVQGVVPDGRGEWNRGSFNLSEMDNRSWNFSFGSSDSLLKKLKKLPRLEDFATVFMGTGTRADQVFLMEKQGSQYFSRSLETWVHIEEELMKPGLTGRDIDPYITDTHNYLFFPYLITGTAVKLFSEEQMGSKYPKAWSYVNHPTNRQILEGRDQGRFRNDRNWYSFSYPRSMRLLGLPKLVLPDVAGTAKFAVDREGRYIIDTCYAIRLLDDEQLSLGWLATILNSPLMTFFLQQTGTDLRGGYFRMKTAYLSPFPIRRIHFTTPAGERQRLGVELAAQAASLTAPDADLAVLNDVAAFRATALGQALDALLPLDEHGQFVAFAEGATGAEERSDVVHDLLAQLAERMIDLNKHKQAETRRFLGWLEAQLEIEPDNKGRTGIDALTGKTDIENYLGDYQKGEDAKPWDEIEKRLYQNKKRFGVGDIFFTPMFAGDLRAEYERSVALLLPIKAQLARTDALIDQIVYRLYGLTADEVAVVRGER